MHSKYPSGNAGRFHPRALRQSPKKAVIKIRAKNHSKTHSTFGGAFTAKIALNRSWFKTPIQPPSIFGSRRSEAERIIN